ncbi:amidohydrolase family protein [Amphibacillus xylanus]|uniref:Putative hydrolase n=1 Tax=Amphibacillus xylanus (strain ATCC 51415 / DSM 6626 / JCM 7361 / LMG 17667 / NBRC 15112 / Ep01) TaxID=698758 RepID=K0IXW2_AMPXN|nr:amidohydrolase family protein [Amphibacillus xylanus]BAM47249.1 putative hydrolase [Amphibacillus xylanus NBRC 15112]
MKKKQKKLFITIIVFLLFFNLIPVSHAVEATFDVVIKGGTIYNPSTDHELHNYNIGINESKIERITQEDLSGITEIDASGLVISPGFIDLVSYDPNHVGIEFKVFDGVTSNLAMHGGTEDAETWYSNWAKQGVITNFGASSFVTRLRWPIVGAGIDTEMVNESDIERLVEETRKNIENGALGISFSFEYVPGVKHEVKPLLELAAEYDVPTFYHLRYSDEEKGLEGIQEVIDYGNETGASIHIMHINSTGGTFVMDQALDMVKNAKKSGLDITTDFYPYDFWATYINSARFRPGWQERFKITYEDLQIGATDIRITKDTFDEYRKQHLLVAAHGSMPMNELYMLLKDPDTMIGSDTIIEPSHNNHPRGAGAYSRLFGRYVREEQVLSMMDAIKKTSYFPAKRMESAAPAMHYKGRIEVGADADITIFNPETIIDKATVEFPGTHSVGVEYVLVNGVVVKNKDGLVNVEKPGKPIRSYFVEEIAHLKPEDFHLTVDETSVIIENVYQLKDDMYLPLALFEQLDLPVQSFKNGVIDIDETINLTVGSNNAIFDGEEFILSGEPILYKEAVYMPMHSVEQILATKYNVDTHDDGLSLSTIESSEQVNDYEDADGELDEASDSVTDEIVESSTDQNSSNGYYLLILVLLLVVLGLSIIFWLRLKKTKN